MENRKNRGPQQPRVIIADDHALVAHALSSALSARHTVVGVASCGDELLLILKNTEADCLILDLEMPGKTGLELIPLIKRRFPALGIVVLTMHVDRAIADAALSSGASAFVPKDCQPPELELAIQEVIGGRTYRSPRLKGTHRIGMKALNPGLQRLTPRQEQILLLLGEGRQAKEIAAELGVHASTITFHKQNIMRELGVETDGALMRLAVLFRTTLGDNS